MSKSNLLQIDGLRLENAILKKGYSLQDASRKLGYSKYFLNNCKNRNTMNNSCVVMLDSMFGISFDDIKKYEPEIIKALEEEPAEAVSEKADCIDYERLCKVIYTATKKAITEALNNE